MSPTESSNKDQSLLPITRPSFDEHEIENIRQVFQSGWVTQGPLTGKFESAFAERHQVRYALATTSCTAALHMSCLAIDLQPGDEMIVPSFTWVTSAHAAEYAGAKAVFCDIDPATFNLDPASVEAAINPRTKAIMAVHLFGLPADIQQIRAIADRHHLRWIEDAACAVGSSYHGCPVGSFGDLACFSLHPRKVITTGEGGVVTTQDEELAERVAALRNHGANRREAPKTARPYDMGCFDSLGYNLRFSDIQSAIGLGQMAKLDGLLEHRRWCALAYSERLRQVDWLRIPVEPEGCGHTYQSYVIWVLDHAPVSRNTLMEHLASKNIQTRPGTMAVHQTDYYREKYQLRPDQFPVSRDAQARTITLPLFPGMTETDIDHVVESIRSAVELPTRIRKAG